ncbi:MAG: thymidine kinase [Rhodoluna sp.]|jgi:thymidine kinase|nr:thymidine kinase [Rhodoluna sp.]
MAKLYFRHGAMNSGKSTALLQVAYNYEERGSKILIAKPAIDAKAADNVTSRLGVSRKVDLLVSPTDNLREEFLKVGEGIACLLIDEAQFLTKEQVEQALAIAVLDGVPVLAYGIRTDFRTAGFPGSTRLLEIAHSLEELKTICRCGRKAMFNARKGATGFVFDGDQVAIDSIDATYESLCANCYMEERAKP